MDTDAAKYLAASDQPAGTSGPRGCDPLANPYRARLPRAMRDWRPPVVRSVSVTTPVMLCPFDPWRATLIFTADVPDNVILFLAPTPQVSTTLYTFELKGGVNMSSGGPFVYAPMVAPYVQLEFVQKGAMVQWEWWCASGFPFDTVPVLVTEQRYVG